MGGREESCGKWPLTDGEDTVKNNGCDNDENEEKGGYDEYEESNNIVDVSATIF